VRLVRRALVLHLAKRWQCDRPAKLTAYGSGQSATAAHYYYPAEAAGWTESGLIGSPCRSCMGSGEHILRLR
jgi:hypothetical protein